MRSNSDICAVESIEHDVNVFIMKHDLCARKPEILCQCRICTTKKRGKLGNLKRLRLRVKLIQSDFDFIKLRCINYGHKILQVFDTPSVFKRGELRKDCSHWEVWMRPHLFRGRMR